MMSPAQIERLAAQFWDRVGGRPAPPRDLEPLLPICQIFRVELPRLSRQTVRNWFQNRPRVPIPPGPTDDRPTLGCVVAYRGLAAIFLDENLPGSLRRVIVAHELGHFLAEYEYPRQRLLRRFGSSILPVLDGDRPATSAECWAGALTGVELAPHAHFLDREFQADAGNRLSERIANAMALELIAPAAEILARVPTSATPSMLVTTLVNEYGLPLEWTAGYAVHLATAAARRTLPSRRWGL